MKSEFEAFTRHDKRICTSQLPVSRAAYTQMSLTEQQKSDRVEKQREKYCTFVRGRTETTIYTLSFEKSSCRCAKYLSNVSKVTRFRSHVLTCPICQTFTFFSRFVETVLYDVERAMRPAIVQVTLSFATMALNHARGNISTSTLT